MSVRIVGVVTGIVFNVTAAFAYAQAVDATQIHACVANSNGVVRIVSATAPCDDRKETRLQWAVAGPTGPQGPPGPMGPQGEPGKGALTVVDSLGRRVGLLFGQQPIYMKLNDMWQILQGVTAERFLEDNQLNLLFSTADCTGQAYVGIGDNLVPRVSVYEGVIYSAANPSARMELNSLRRTEPSGTECVPYRDNIVVAPAIPIPVSTLGFV
jgi:hypothetical protein